LGAAAAGFYAMGDEGSYRAAKRSSLTFKGEDPSLKKKRKKHRDPLKKSRDDADDEGGADADGPVDVPLVQGSGRIVSSTVTVHGFETKFKDEVDIGDTVLLHHPVSLEVEMRVVTGILSQRSLLLHQGFSKDVVSTMDYHIRKDSLKLKEKVKASLAEADNPNELVQDAVSAELQQQLDKKLKKQRKLCTIREKTGMWGYKMVTRKLDKEATQENLLDERCKQGRDKYCR